MPTNLVARIVEQGRASFFLKNFTPSKALKGDSEFY